MTHVIIIIIIVLPWRILTYIIFMSKGIKRRLYIPIYTFAYELYHKTFMHLYI